jgi:hypothetical protein
VIALRVLAHGLLGSIVCLGLVLGLALTLAALDAHDAEAAEVVELEVVGAIPMDARARRNSIPKDRAIDEALWQGVSRVAAELIAENPFQPLEPDYDPDAPGGDGNAGDASDGGTEGDGGEPDDPIREALGNDMVPYTRSFKIVEDQGERPVLFTDNPDAATEYVVIMAVHVDVDKLKERLAAAGLLAQAEIEILTGILLEVRGLTQYRGYQKLVELLQSEAVGAVAVSPRQLERGRALLQVEGEWGPEELLDRLLAATTPELTIVPISVEESGGYEPGGGSTLPGAGRLSVLVVGVRWTRPPPPSEASEDGAKSAGTSQGALRIRARGPI